jgi:hypothetical protein
MFLLSIHHKKSCLAYSYLDFESDVHTVMLLDPDLLPNQGRKIFLFVVGILASIDRLSKKYELCLISRRSS